MFFRILTIAALALLFLTLQIGLGYALGLALKTTGAVDPLAILDGDLVALLPMAVAALIATVAAAALVFALLEFGPALAQRFREWRDPLAGLAFTGLRKP